MLLSGFVWADVVAGLVRITTNLNPDQTEFQMTMDSLNDFMRKQKLNTALRQRLVRPKTPTPVPRRLVSCSPYTCVPLGVCVCVCVVCVVCGVCVCVCVQREYFHQTAHLRASEKGAQLMAVMSPALQAEVCWIINHKWCALSAIDVESCSYSKLP